MHYTSPHNGEPLVRYAPNLLDDGELLWPVVDNIAYLRPRHDLREQAVALLQTEKEQEALIVLLQDQDRFAPLSPPGPQVLQTLVVDPAISLRKAMELLNYGPVADYFAYRWATPTYLSGLALLQQIARIDQPVIEVACGMGHFLRTMEANGLTTVGVDVVFSKLWLARRYLGVKGTLVCADVERLPPLSTEHPHSVFCHDAFYFFEHKITVLSALRAMASKGNLAIGHVHTNATDHSVAGFPLAVDDYRKMAAKQARFFDDTALIASWLDPHTAQSSLEETLNHAEAIAWIEGEVNEERYPLHQPAAPLSLNPLLEISPTGVDRHWPSERFRAEYEADSAYLHVSQEDASALNDPERMNEEKKAEFFRRRILLDLPQSW